MNQTNLLKIHNFKPIGKAVLHRLIGLRENYIIEEPELPESCKSCPFFHEMETYKLFPESPEYKNALKSCNQCDNHLVYNCWSTKNSPTYKKYVNETNRYGAGKRLKYTAVILFITYHMVCTSQHGILKDIPIIELAELIGCSQKAIRYNNEVLQKEGYIYLTKGSIPGTVNVCLKDYTAYFNKADKGGRGFLTVSKELYTSLLSLKSSNQLRIILKLLLDNDSSIPSFTGEITESYVDMKRYLPKYCKRNVIQKALDNIDTAICSVKLSLHTVRFKINPDFNGKIVKENLRRENLATIKQNIISAGETIKNALRLNEIPKFKDRFFAYLQHNDSIPAKRYEPLTITEKQLGDLADISLEYSADMVLTAVASIYFSMICNKQHIKNFGGLIRETIKFNLNNNSSIALY